MKRQQKPPKVSEKILKIDRAILLTFASLKSHLPSFSRDFDVEPYDHHFDRRCVKEYAEVIKTLADLL